MAFASIVQKMSVSKYMLFMAVVKSSVAGAGLALAALASIDFAIAVFIKETWDAWQIDQLINRFAISGAVLGSVVQVVKLVISR